MTNFGFVCDTRLVEANPSIYYIATSKEKRRDKGERERKTRHFLTCTIKIATCNKILFYTGVNGSCKNIVNGSLAHIRQLAASRIERQALALIFTSQSSVVEYGNLAIALVTRV